MTSDLDFSMEASGGDELGALCGAFEAMRAQLLENNQALWRQSEERRRLNAAFSHDLRNPLAVLQGTVQLLRRQGRPRLDQLDQLERLHRPHPSVCGGHGQRRPPGGSAGPAPESAL